MCWSVVCAGRIHTVRCSQWCNQRWPPLSTSKVESLSCFDKYLTAPLRSKCVACFFFNISHIDGSSRPVSLTQKNKQKNSGECCVRSGFHWSKVFQWGKRIDMIAFWPKSWKNPSSFWSLFLFPTFNLILMSIKPFLPSGVESFAAYGDQSSGTGRGWEAPAA